MFEQFLNKPREKISLPNYMKQNVGLLLDMN